MRHPSWFYHSWEGSSSSHTFPPPTSLEWHLLYLGCQASVQLPQREAQVGGFAVQL